ncbi:MAG: hypothetical protein QNK23_00755 [Crocinitomicaceae bacterium]|nr:hypothetical protein [Crocinitomicaceae bacterium]
MLIRITSWVFNLTSFCLYVGALKMLLSESDEISAVSFFVPFIAFIIGGIMLLYTWKTRHFVEIFYSNKKSGDRQFMPVKISLTLNWVLCIANLLFFLTVLVLCVMMLYVQVYDFIRPLFFLGIVGVLFSLAPLHYCYWNIKALIFVSRNRRNIGQHKISKWEAEAIED